MSREASILSSEASSDTSGGIDIVIEGIERYLGRLRYCHRRHRVTPREVSWIPIDRKAEGIDQDAGSSFRSVVSTSSGLKPNGPAALLKAMRPSLSTT
jgi:hypothetical protein